MMFDNNNVIRLNNGIVLPLTYDVKGGVCDESFRFIPESKNSESWLTMGGAYSDNQQSWGGGM